MKARERPISYDDVPVLCDVNILVADCRRDHPHHHLARAALSALDINSTLAYAHLIHAAVVRIITSPRIFVEPTPLIDAFAAVETYARHPTARRIEPGSDHWRIFRELCQHTGIRGGDTSDAWHAALAIEHGCHWWTFDRDFIRFPGLKVRLLTSD